MDNEDISNDIVAINSDDDEEMTINSDKPIIQLFKRLINSDNKQNTVLTNAQIVDILNKEFEINISELHELEGDIYLTIMKKFLKDWPQWDEFDSVINNLKSENKNIEMEKIFQSKYINLRNYLKAMLDVAQKSAKENIQRVIAFQNSMEKENKVSTSNGSVVLEIQASRNQLNQLFFRQPNLNLNETLFNHTYSVPTQIQLTTLPIEAILNWWGVNISILNSTKISLYRREIKHELKHMLINRKLVARLNPLKVLDQSIEVNNFQTALKIDTSLYINFLEKLALESNECREIYDFIKRDLKTFPERIPPRVFLKRYTNKYPYIRYLYVDTNEMELKKKFDIQLEETLSPCYLTYIGPIQDTNVTLIICCEPCKAKFTGQYLVRELKAHFDEQHNSEPDWKCTNCNKKFPMVELAQNWWCHRC